MTPNTQKLIEETHPEAYKLAREFHALYEELAPKFGYETRKDTKEFDPASPNGRLMARVCWDFAEQVRRETISEIEKMLDDNYRGQRKIGEDVASFQPRVDDMDFGWNDAISKISSLLSDLKE